MPCGPSSLFRTLELLDGGSISTSICWQLGKRIHEAACSLCSLAGRELGVAKAAPVTGRLELALSYVQCKVLRRQTCMQGPAKVPQPRAESAVPPRAFKVKHAVGSKTLPYEELKGEVLQTPDKTARCCPSCMHPLQSRNELPEHTGLTVC